jgi:hypothetical protein
MHQKVTEVSYDPDKNPNRLSVRYQESGGGVGRVELFFNSRRVDRVKARVSTEGSQAAVDNPIAGAGIGAEAGAGAGTGTTTTAGSVDVWEQVRQSSARQAVGRKASQTIGDYLIHTHLQQRSSSSSGSGGGGDYEGFVHVYSYLIPQDPLFERRPSQPVGVFRYDITMQPLEPLQPAPAM